MKKSLKKIGWIQSEANFQRGEVPKEFSQKIVDMLIRERVNLLRSVKTCPICNDKEWKYADEEKKVLLGCSEILVPVDDFMAFSAPDLIIHYVNAHNFLPPQDFIEAVERFDLKSDWSGSLYFDEVKRR